MLPQHATVGLLIEIDIGMAHGQVDLPGPLKQRTGLRPLVLLRQHGGEVSQTEGDPWVRGPERLLPNRQGALMERTRPRHTAPARVELGQIAESAGHVRVRGAERLLPNRQGPLMEGLGLGIPPLLLYRAWPDG